MILYIFFRKITYIEPKNKKTQENASHLLNNTIEEKGPKEWVKYHDPSPTN